MRTVLLIRMVWKKHGSDLARRARPLCYVSSMWQKRTQGFIHVFSRTGKTQKCGSLGFIFGREVCILKSQALNLLQLNTGRLWEFQDICPNSGGKWRSKCDWIPDLNKTSAFKSVALWHITQNWKFIIQWRLYHNVACNCGIPSLSSFREHLTTSSFFMFPTILFSTVCFLFILFFIKRLIVCLTYLIAAV